MRLRKRCWWRIPTQRCSCLAPEGDVVAWVDLGRYVGEWYEIATTPSQQQSFCSGTRAIYEAGDAGRINVTNQCYQGSLDGRMQEVLRFVEQPPPSLIRPPPRGSYIQGRELDLSSEDRAELIMHVETELSRYPMLREHYGGWGGRRGPVSTEV